MCATAVDVVDGRAESAMVGRAWHSWLGFWREWLGRAHLSGMSPSLLHNRGFDACSTCSLHLVSNRSFVGGRFIYRRRRLPSLLGETSAPVVRSNSQISNDTHVRISKRLQRHYLHALRQRILPTDTVNGHLLPPHARHSATSRHTACVAHRVAEPRFACSRDPPH